MKSIMGQSLRYISQGRSGYVIYKEGEAEIKLFYEFGGDACVAMISIPSKNDWEAQTNIPLFERDKILTYIAEQVIKDQAPNCKFVIAENWIEILEK